MTKSKKHARPSLEEALAQPWCYYCEKTCTDVSSLLNHQKDKHFQCPCRRRLNTAGGLKVHMAQVHKEELKEVPNALPHRKDPSIEVFTTVGIPEDILRQRQQEVEAEFYKAEYEHRLRTGNPAPGTVQGPAKKQKIESSESLKARVAARRAEAAARRAAEAAGSPVTTANSPLPTSTPTSASPAIPAGSHPFPFRANSNGHGDMGYSPTYPDQHMVTAGRPTQFPGAPFISSPIPGQNGVFPHNGYPVPPMHPTYAATPPRVATSPTAGSTPPNGPSNGNAQPAQGSNPIPGNMPLPKLCEYGLDAIKALSKTGTKQKNATSKTEAAIPSADLFTAISKKIYGSATTNPTVLSKAEIILRGLLKCGVDTLLPTGFAHGDKIRTLKQATTTAITPPDHDEEQKTKAKKPENRKLSHDGISWEESIHLRHSTENGHSALEQVTGPANDAVTGVVGDGEMGSSVMEE